MNILVNAEPRDISANTLADAIVELGLQNPAIATAVNGAFVPRQNRAATRLNDGDRLEVLAPMQGG